MISVAVYGSTGSIGVQTLNVLRRYPDLFKIESLSCGNNTDLFKKQVEEFKPDFCASLSELNLGSDCLTGKDAIERMAERSNADISVFAIPGTDSVYPLISVIKKGKRIALASKEALVTAGEIVKCELNKSGAQLIPVDGEHSAIFQCISSNRKEDIKKIILTASGGPFYGKDLEYLKKVTPAQAINHPTLKMGKKVSVDSASMVNKGLELIEAKYLFDCDNIDYCIHPESIIHGLVEFKDNATISLMSYPSMELPIQYALSYPNRLEVCAAKPFDFSKPLTFLEKDEKVFKGPLIAKECIKKGSYYPAVFSMADEFAVKMFLESKIIFPELFDVIDFALSSSYFIPKDIDDIKLLNNKVKEVISAKYSL